MRHFFVTYDCHHPVGASLRYVRRLPFSREERQSSSVRIHTRLRPDLDQYTTLIPLAPANCDETRVIYSGNPDSRGERCLLKSSQRRFLPALGGQCIFDIRKALILTGHPVSTQISMSDLIGDSRIYARHACSPLTQLPKSANDMHKRLPRAAFNCVFS